MTGSSPRLRFVDPANSRYFDHLGLPFLDIAHIAETIFSRCADVGHLPPVSEIGVVAGFSPDAVRAAYDALIALGLRTPE